MGQPFVGEIRIFAGNFAPAGWAFCSGQLMPISENEVLFQIIGTTYGGDGQATFALPNLQSRLPIHQGTSSQTGSTFVVGQSAGTEEVTLTIQQIPIHTHQMLASTGAPTLQSPAGNVTGSSVNKIYRSGNPSVTLNPAAVGVAGGSQPHENRQPFLVVNFIISLFGIFPTRP